MWTWTQIMLVNAFMNIFLILFFAKFVKLKISYMENPLTLVVTLASTSANSWYPLAYHSWYITTKAITAVWSKSLSIPSGTFWTVTTLGVSYSKKDAQHPVGNGVSWPTLKRKVVFPFPVYFPGFEKGQYGYPFFCGFDEEFYWLKSNKLLS